MQYIFIPLAALILLITAAGIVALIRERSIPTENMVRLSRILPVVGIFDAVFFSILGLISFFSEEAMWIPIVFFFFSSLGAILILAFINCRITYDEEGFTAKNFFGIKKRYSYDEVTALKEKVHETYLCMDKRKVMLDHLSVEREIFLGYVENKYRTIHNGTALPKLLPNKKDLFHGNIRDPEGIIFSYVFVGILILGLAAFSVKLVYFSPYSADNTIEQQVTFRTCYEDGEHFVMRSTDGELYKIQFIDEQVSLAPIRSVCAEKTEVTVFSKRYTPDDAPAFYSVKAIYRGDNALFTFEEANRLNTQEYRPIVWITVAIVFLWAGYIAGSIIVGRNPKKYGKKIVKQFFKDSYVRY